MPDAFELSSRQYAKSCLAAVLIVTAIIVAVIGAANLVTGTAEGLVAVERQEADSVTGSVTGYQELW